MNRALMLVHPKFFRRFMLFTLVLFLGAVSPVFGQVKSARARVLEQPGDIMTTRKANFQPGDILSTSLISINIKNGDGEAFLLLKMKIQFGGDWRDEYVEASFVKKLATNESFTFTNKDLLNYLGNIRSNDFKYSETLISKTGISDVSQIANIGNIRIPEGTVSITLTVSEITLSDPNDINSSYTVKTPWITETDPNAKVEFNVVTIGNLEVVKLPTFDSLTLSFKVPEIPVYNDAKGTSTSSTKVKITGANGYSYTMGKDHLKSTAGSLSFKGYPGDLKADSGKVTYDLSGARFRAGETYSMDMSFIDWNGDTIISLTKSVTFPTPSLTQSATINKDDPFRPTFSWSFRTNDYSSWVKEYRVFVNDRYVGTTNDTSYTLTDPLTPSSTNSWYIMPYNKDGTAFFSSTSGILQTLTAKSHTELAVITSAPENRSVFFKGETYDFKGAATFYDGATEKTSTWKIGNDSKSGLEISYAPQTRYTNNSLSATLSVTDSLGLTKTSPALQLTVLDPAIAMPGVPAVTVDKGASMTFSLDGSKTRDLSTYEWFVGGSSAGTGTGPKSITFNEKGKYEVYVQGTTVADLKGDTKTLQSSKIIVTVAGTAPVVSISQPTSGSGLILGNTVRVKASIESENVLKSTAWTVSGPDASQTGATGAELAFKPLKVGEYTLTCVAADEFQKSGQAQIRILVSDPSITIAKPAQGDVYALTATLIPSISAPNASRIAWYIDDTEISGSSYALAKGGTGEFTLKATGFWRTVDIDGKDAEYSESVSTTFKVKDLTPPRVTISFPENAMVLKAGEIYRFYGTAESDSSIAGTWWDVDGTKLATEFYTIPANTTKKSMTITFSAKNDDGIVNAKSVTLRIVNPSVFLSAPSIVQYPVGGAIPISATAIDSTIFWLIDDVETSTWNKTFDQAGVHTVQAGWRVTAVDGSRSTKEYSGLSDKVSFTIYDTQIPVINSFSPASPTLKELLGTNITFSLSASSDNPLKATQWRITSGQGVVLEWSGASVFYSFGDPGQYAVLASASDTFGYSASAEWTVKIIKPSISVEFATSERTFGLNAVPTPSVTSQDIASYAFVLDGQTLPKDFNWSTVSVGVHQLKAIGYYSVSSLTGSQEIQSNPVTFEVVDTRPPTFTVEGLTDGDRIIAGQRYTFRIVSSQSPLFVEWLMNGSLVDNPDAATNPKVYSFTAAADSADLNLTARVRGSSKGVAAEKTVKVKVIAPSIRIVLPAAMSRNSLYPAQTALPLQAETSQVDRVAWTVDNQASTGQTVSLTPGNHTLAVKGFATGVRLSGGSYGEYEVTPREFPNGVTITVAEPLTLATLSATPASIYSGETVNVAVTTAGNGTLLDSFVFSVDGSVLAQGKTASISIPNLSVGTHKISAKVTDLFGTSSGKDVAVTVYQPLGLTITQPANGFRLAPDSNLFVAMTASGQYSKLFWTIDTAQVPNSGFTSGSLGKLKPGIHTIGVSATDSLNKVVSASVSVEVQSDFLLNILYPSGSLEAILGTTVACAAGIEKVAGADIPLADAAGYITWYVNGSPKEKGLSYSFVADALGNQVIQAKYEKGAMIRATAERTVIVRDIAEPAILKPANGASLVYALGDTIELQATGEPGASFVWSIDGAAVAYGSQGAFAPNGLTGQKQLSLTASAFGRTKEALATVNLAVDAPPILTLTAPPLLFTGQRLSWTASVFDVEDQESPAIDIYMDGVLQDSANPKMLTAEDVGQHVLSARSKDKQNLIATRQVSIKVEPGELPLEIQSPLPGKVYYSGFNIPLIASVDTGVAESAAQGTFTWTIQYLDDTTAQEGIASGQSTSIRPSSLGEVAVTLRYIDAAGRERGKKQISLRVDPEPLQLSIEWPHGAMVNAGTALKPKLIGLPAGADAGTAVWSLNGLPVSDINALVAPSVAGQYTLAAEYFANGSRDRAELLFSVNGAPIVRIETPASGQRFTFGSAIVLSAKIEDDQPFNGSITWKSGDRILGTENPAVALNLEPGQYNITIDVVDRFGAAASAQGSFLVYRPASIISAAVNGGQPVYLLSEQGSPLAAKLSLEGGIAPAVSWTLAQGDLSRGKTGNEASFGYEDLRQFSEGQAVVTAIVADKGLTDEGAVEVYRKDFPIEFVLNAAATLISPIQGDMFRVGEPVPLMVGVAGFNQPSFSLTFNGQSIETKWTKTEGTSTYQASIPAETLASDGVFELAIQASENGITSSIAYTLNVYKPRVGIFVDSPPEKVDLTGQPGTVRALVAGLQGVDSILWRSDLSANPIGTGETLDLAAAGLKPGDRSITVEAHAGSQTLSTATFLLKVYGAMELQVLPAETPLIFQRGTAMTMDAAAKDRDGSALTADAITWTSHIDGLLGKGNSLNLGSLANLTGGDHIITIEATGVSGTKIAVLKQIQVKVPQAKGLEGSGGSGDQGGGSGEGGGSGNLDDGEEMQGGQRRTNAPTYAQQALGAAIEVTIALQQSILSFDQANRMVTEMTQRNSAVYGNGGPFPPKITSSLTLLRGMSSARDRLIRLRGSADGAARQAVQAELRNDQAGAKAAMERAIAIADEAENTALMQNGDFAMLKVIYDEVMAALANNP